MSRPLAPALRASGWATLGAVAALAFAARADEPTPPAPPSQVVCRLFLRDLDKDREFDTADKVGEIGAWVAGREAQGYRVDSIGFSTAQKPTGYPQGWVQVCARR